MSASAKMSILIVDDDPNLRKTLCDILAAKGYAPVAAATGQAALDRVEEKAPAVALIDLKLEDVSGLEVMEELKERCPGTECIVLTGYATQASAIEAINLGAYSYLQKPYDIEQLLVTIRRAVEKREAEEALRQSEERFRTVVEHQTDLICRFLPDGTLTFVNQAYCRYHGQQRQELIGHSFMSHVPPEERERVAQHLASFSPEKPVATIEHRAVAAGGKVRWQQWINRPIFDEQGNVTEFQAVGRDVTERKRAEEVLRASEERYFALFNNANDLIQITNPAGKILAVNKRWLATLEYSQEDVKDLRVTDILREDKIPQLSGLLQEVARGELISFETVFISKSGKEINVEGNGNGLFKGGKFISAVGIFRDITERKRAEETLKHRMEQLAALGQASQALTASLELDQVMAKIVSLTSEVAAADYTSVALIDEAGHLSQSTENMPDVPSVEYRVRDEGLTSWIMRSRQGVVIDEISEDGAMTPALGEGAPRFANSFIVEAGVKSVAGLPLESSGRLLGVLYLHSLRPAAFQGQLPLLTTFANQVAIAIENARLYEAAQRELAARKRAEGERERLLTQIQEQAQQVQQIIATVPEGVLLLNRVGRVILANPLGKKHLATLADAQIGDILTRLGDRPLAELLTSPPKGLWHEVATDNLLFEIIARPLDIELESKVPVLSTVEGPALSPAEGLALSMAEEWVLVIRDVTQEWEIQQRAQRQERLAAVGQLAGGIAHDFNNLLTTIMLYAQMPLTKGKPDLPPNVTRSFEIILDESRRAAELVQQILDFSRRSPIQTSPMDLGPFVQKTLRVLERTIPENIDLRFAAGPEEYVVNADPTRIQQVLMNLATNGRDAMPEGGEMRFELSRVQVQPGAEPPVAEMGSGEWVCLAVSDTGTGIPPEALARIFEPFFTTKEPGKGTGLGLAQVHGIVAQHGGHIGVETEAGKGTTFRVYLRASGAGEDVADEEVSAALEGKGETILLVEDNEKLRTGGQSLLESLGYRVLTAANGREALEVYQAAKGTRPEQGRRIDLVITDLVMPEMGGKMLLRKLREMAPDLKALAITGYTVGENVQELKEAGFLDVAHKPFDVVGLAQVVRRALDGE